MNKKEFATFAMGMKTYYPRESLIPDNEAMELWYSALCDIQYGLAITFLQKWVMVEKWPPSIADIRAGCMQILEEPLPDWGEAWRATIKAISRYGHMREREALDSLPKLTRETVERLGYQHLCMSENEIADRAQFRNVYEILLKRESEDRQLPIGLQETISQYRLGRGQTNALSPGTKTEGTERK